MNCKIFLILAFTSLAYGKRRQAGGEDMMGGPPDMGGPPGGPMGGPMPMSGPPGGPPIMGGAGQPVGPGPMTVLGLGPPGVEWGCATDIFFGDDKWSLKGLEYCAHIGCNNLGNNPDGGNVAYCESVKMANTSMGPRNHDITYFLNCRCPEIGHTTPPNCESRLRIGFKLVPRTTYLDCFNSFDRCGGGKYCFLSREKVQCPTTCVMQTEAKYGKITVLILYDCCKSI